ncbi:hypothetical protein HPB50_017417 [Hyalomma asiaticum]|uniref:Uncharacterized protein n=1 Tax=Hyalomma asiaticum TaxID=266040 RepID=A0ACB7SKJ4_HYAAI|nr:hypothetical protein HPB50_017417 [Hyalomma asiaticum]
MTTTRGSDGETAKHVSVKSGYCRFDDGDVRGGSHGRSRLRLRQGATPITTFTFRARHGAGNGQGTSQDTVPPRAGLHTREESWSLGLAPRFASIQAGAMLAAGAVPSSYGVSQSATERTTSAAPSVRCQKVCLRPFGRPVRDGEPKRRAERVRAERVYGDLFRLFAN